MMMESKSDVFTVESDPIEVTSLNRPDESWIFTDAAGHRHQWEWPDGRRVYQPDKPAKLPTLQWVIDGTSYYPDGEPYTYGHYECVECHEHVDPRTRADTWRQYIPGIKRYYVNGEAVTEEEFKARARLAGYDV